MHQVVEAKRPAIAGLCRELSVRRLDVFGSAVGDRFDVRSSDVDFLVDFDVGPNFDYFDHYFRLKEQLEKILGRPVDVVTASSIHNPYFEQRVMATRETLYAA
jgi:predicted nucleotidyltransferase